MLIIQEMQSDGSKDPESDDNSYVQVGVSVSLCCINHDILDILG